MNKLTHILELLFGIWKVIEPYALGTMPYVGLIIAIVYGKTVHDYIQTIPGAARKRHWLRRVGFNLGFMVIVIFRVHDPFNLQLSMGGAFFMLIVLKSIEMRADTRYYKKNYIATFFFESTGKTMDEAKPFDIVAFLILMRQLKTMVVGNLKVELLDDRPGVVARLKFTFLEDDDFPYQWHQFVEMTQAISGIVRVNGKLVEWGAWVRIEENQVHNVSGTKGSEALSEFYEIELLPSTSIC